VARTFLKRGSNKGKQPVDGLAFWKWPSSSASARCQRISVLSRAVWAMMAIPTMHGAYRSARAAWMPLQKNFVVRRRCRSQVDVRTPRTFPQNEPAGHFAVGDVRSGSVKRVPAAVGEGAAAIQSLHQYLALDG
jgi:hypothetical protein